MIFDEHIFQEGFPITTGAKPTTFHSKNNIVDLEGSTVGFQTTLGLEVIGSKKTNQKTSSAGIWKTRSWTPVHDF